MSLNKNRVCIGIPCYQNAPAETLEDYMRFAYWLGRRAPEYEFFLAIKSKSEQFRARNAIFGAAAQLDCDYLLMLDDDQVIDWEDSQQPSDKYGFPLRLIEHLKNDPKLGMVGALYYHRGGECLPVIMKEGKDGGYYFMRDDEVTGRLQEVAVTGGGCMMMRVDVLLQIPQPVFGPEFQYGTDIQVAQKMKDAGFRVACDTSIVLGHCMTTREVITPKNRHRIMADLNRPPRDEQQISTAWRQYSNYALYQQDALEFAKVDADEMLTLYDDYQKRLDEEFPAQGDHTPEEYEQILKDYYIARGKHQLARQVMFHGSSTVLQNDDAIFNIIKPGQTLYGLEYGCGSGPIGGTLALHGHKMDFVDIPGTYAYEFLKWRMQKRGVMKRCHFDEVRGPYDFILLLDILEHLPNPTKLIDEMANVLKQNGILVTNYFFLSQDERNKEHITMNMDMIQKALVDNGIYPLNKVVWMKRDLAFMDDKSKKDAVNALMAAQ